MYRLNGKQKRRIRLSMSCQRREHLYASIAPIRTFDQLRIRFEPVESIPLEDFNLPAGGILIGNQIVVTHGDQRMAESKPITLAQAVEQIIDHLDGPISLDALTQRVLEIRPSKAKDPKGNIRTHLRWDQEGKTLVFLDRATIMPLRLAMRGVRFRVPISPQAAGRGALPIQPFFDHFLRRGLSAKDATLIDAAGVPLPNHIVEIDQPYEDVMAQLMDVDTFRTPAFELEAWFLLNDIAAGDDVLVTIEDWQHGHFRLEHDAAPRRDEIEHKNQELADLLFDMLEESQREALYAFRAIPTAYIRMTDPRGYPGDHWLSVVDHDPRMIFTGFEIRYADFIDPFDAFSRIFDEEPSPLIEEARFTSQQAQQVYRFKAALQHRPSIWRVIEIQGDHTLADLDLILREAFQHDTWDHLGGFWKLVPRGKTKRVREVDLGDVNPLGEGSAAEVHLAVLELKPGDQLKYVYDFGDWIEHTLTLEAIEEAQADADYPRITGRNKPRYSYCPSCREQGRKTVATWICIDCSNKQQRAVVACEDCLRTKHQDHYAEEILY